MSLMESSVKLKSSKKVMGKHVWQPKKLRLEADFLVWGKKDTERLNLRRVRDVEVRRMPSMTAFPS